MPGPAIHHHIATSFAKRLREQGYDKFTDEFLASLSGTHASAFYLGCQGPDPLFFNTKDWKGAMGSIVEFMLGVHDFMKDMKEKIMGIVPEEIYNVIDKIEQFKDDVEQRSVFIGQATAMLNESKRLMDTLKKMIETKGKDYFFKTIDLFGLVSHPVQDKTTLFGDDPYYGERVWWWFDLLHYRRTGVYLKTLLETAPADSAELAYALGYVTHFAGDVTGHPFVNIISGGPYRTHAQRHKLAENYQDAWAWKKYYDSQFVKSNLASAYNFGYTEELPDHLADYIVKAMHSTYGSPYMSKKATSDIDRGDIKATYRMWMIWFKSATNVDELPTPKAFSFTAEVEESWKKFLENLGDIAGLAGSPSGSSGSVWDFFKALFAGILGTLLAGLALIDFLLGMITLLGTAPMRYLINQVYENLFKVYMDFQRGVSFSGLAHPFNVHLDHPYMRHLLDTGMADVRGTTAMSTEEHYPYKKYYSSSIEDGMENHMVYPRAHRDGYVGEVGPLCLAPANETYFVEHDNTAAAPLSYYDANPSHYIEGTNGLTYTDWIFDHLANAKGAIDLRDMRKILSADSLGSAVDFSVAVLDRFYKTGSIPDMNLDADRGYGYRCWKRVMDDNPDRHTAVESDPCFGTHEVRHGNVEFMNPESDQL